MLWSLEKKKKEWRKWSSSSSRADAAISGFLRRTASVRTFQLMVPCNFLNLYPTFSLADLFNSGFILFDYLRLISFSLPIKRCRFCGNHNPNSDGHRIPCPLDPSHSVLEENIDAHIKRCPFLKQEQYLRLQPYFKKGINAGSDEEEEAFGLGSKPIQDSGYVASANMKRDYVFKMAVHEFLELIRKIEVIHNSICSELIRDSYKIPEACSIWMNKEIDRKLPFQEKHVLQQASILGNLEELGVLEVPEKDAVGSQLDRSLGLNGSTGSNDAVPAVVEFGAGRGYLTQMLADCYGIKKVFLVERKSYKLKADRSLRQKDSLTLERLRIDIEDLDLNSIKSLSAASYLAIGKHLCGPATDLTLRCCLPKQYAQDNAMVASTSSYPKGLAIATCCHHLCQWKHYINKNYLSSIGITKEEFHAITWFTSWAVDADHGSDLLNMVDQGLSLSSISEKGNCDADASSVEGIARSMAAVERAALGLMCKDIIDMGRLLWMRGLGLDAKLVKYVPSNISPENRLLVAKSSN